MEFQRHGNGKQGAGAARVSALAAGGAVGMLGLLLWFGYGHNPPPADPAATPAPRPTQTAAPIATQTAAPIAMETAAQTRVAAPFPP